MNEKYFDWAGWCGVLLEVMGITMISFGFYLTWKPVGYIFAGASLMCWRYGVSLQLRKLAANAKAGAVDNARSDQVADLKEAVKK